MDDLGQPGWWWQTPDPLLPLLVQPRHTNRSPRPQIPAQCKSSHVPRARWKEGGGEGEIRRGGEDYSKLHTPTRPPLRFDISEGENSAYLLELPRQWSCGLRLSEVVNNQLASTLPRPKQSTVPLTPTGRLPGSTSAGSRPTD